MVSFSRRGGGNPSGFEGWGAWPESGLSSSSGFSGEVGDVGGEEVSYLYGLETCQALEEFSIGLEDAMSVARANTVPTESKGKGRKERWQGNGTYSRLDDAAASH